MKEQEFILNLSESFNNNGTFELIRLHAQDSLNLDLDNDSDVWHRIEEAILDTIIECEEENN